MNSYISLVIEKLKAELSAERDALLSARNNVAAIEERIGCCEEVLRKLESVNEP